MEQFDIVFNPLPGEALTRLLVDGLHAHGIAETGISTWYPVGFFLKSERGEWLDGLMSHPWGGWLYVRFLWVSSSARGCGNGTRLLQAAEEYAVERGCWAATLETTSFQARPFHEKLGCRVFASLEDYPLGHTKFYLRKQLAPNPSSR